MAARQPELPARVGGETESGTQAGVWSTAWGQAVRGMGGHTVLDGCHTGGRAAPLGAGNSGRSSPTCCLRPGGLAGKVRQTGPKDPGQSLLFLNLSFSSREMGAFTFKSPRKA